MHATRIDHVGWLSGALDPTTCIDLAAFLAELTDQSSRDAVVDLDGVTAVSHAALAVLLFEQGRTRRAGHQLQLIARDRSVAADALDGLGVRRYPDLAHTT